ncbi:hypothetical protein RHOER0001_6540 [Rhodococcus erythropolis SK121]|nr:hypothetical protein RHOER0001_6540 [Rhodococcus erythropolis SK121]
MREEENSDLRSYPLENLTETGTGTGIEVEATSEVESESTRIEEPFDPDKIDVTTRTPTIDLLVSRTRSGAIDLQPDFQRKAGIWDEQRRSRLIESLLLRIPLPTLYAAEDDDENWAIVDGIQRLTSIVQFIDGALIEKAPLQLSNLEYLTKYNGKTYADLPAKLQLRLRETELVLHLIRRGTPEPVKFNIFARINTGGLPLSNQELRHALIAGPIRERLKLLASSSEFIAATTGSVRDDRMADREMVLRHLAFKEINVSQYTAKDFDGFLSASMGRYNRLTDEQFITVEDQFKRAMTASMHIFGRYAFRKVYDTNAGRMPLNKALFEAISVNVAKRSDKSLKAIFNRADSCVDKFIKLMDDSVFVNSISSGTGDTGKVRYRFNSIDNMLNEVENDQ